MKKLLLFLLFPFFLFAEDPPLRVNFAWDPSPDATVTGYKLYYSNTSGQYNATNSVDQGLGNTGHLVGLKSRTQYYFVATAYNAEGLESDYSNEVAYVTPEYRPRLQLLNSTISFLSPPGDSFLIEQTNNFLVWGGLGTGVENNGKVQVKIENTTAPYLFFRARLLPRDQTTALQIASAAMVIKLPPIPIPKKRYEPMNEMKGAEYLMYLLKQSRDKKPALPPMPGVK